MCGEYFKCLNNIYNIYNYSRPDPTRPLSPDPQHTLLSPDLPSRLHHPHSPSNRSHVHGPSTLDIYASLPSVQCTVLRTQPTHGLPVQPFSQTVTGRWQETASTLKTPQ